MTLLALIIDALTLLALKTGACDSSSTFYSDVILVIRIRCRIFVEFFQSSD